MFAALHLKASTFLTFFLFCFVVFIFLFFHKSVTAAGKCVSRNFNKVFVFKSFKTKLAVLVLSNRTKYILISGFF